MKDNRVLLVTGASSEMGRALIRRIYGNYSRIYAHYNSSAESLEELREETGDRLFPVRADFADVSSVEDLVENIRREGILPDHIVHMVSPKLRLQKFKKTSPADFEEGIDISLLSIVRILEAFLPDMAKRKYGKVVFMLSADTIGTPPSFQAPYVTQKYALLGLMNSLSAEYASYGVTVNGVSPDMTETRFLSEIPDTAVRLNAEKSPLHRNLTPGDVAPAFEYLLSDGADAVTGVNLPVKL